MRHNSPGICGRRSARQSERRRRSEPFHPGPAYVSGRCTDCGGDLTLNEMREHNYSCHNCYRGLHGSCLPFCRSV